TSTLLADGALLPGDRKPRPALRPRVRVRPLAVAREVPPVPVAAVGADLDQPPDVLLDVLAELALDAPLLGDDRPDARDFLLRELLALRLGVHARLAEDDVRARASDAVDVRQSDLHPLVLREVHAGDTSHVLRLLPG